METYIIGLIKMALERAIYSRGSESITLTRTIEAGDQRIFIEPCKIPIKSNKALWFGFFPVYVTTEYPIGTEELEIMPSLFKIASGSKSYPNSSVSIGDFGILDSNVNSCCIIESSATFETTRYTGTPITTWNITLMPHIRYTDFELAKNLFRDTRSKIVLAVTTPVIDFPTLVAYKMISIKANEEVFLREPNKAGFSSKPIFIGQMLEVTVEDYEQSYGATIDEVVWENS